MRKKIIWLLLASLMISSGPVFAADWEFFAKGNNPRYGTYDTYIDKDTVVKNGYNLIFWELQVLDQSDQTGAKKYLFKMETITSNPRSYRILEAYRYDADGNKTLQEPKPYANYVPVNPWYNREIDFAIRYAKAGRDPGQLDMLFEYNLIAGFYIREIRGRVNDPQGLWQALLPLQPPPGARGAYGLIGDDILLGQDPGYGLKQLGKIARQYLTVDYLYVDQPTGFKEMGVQDGVFTSVESLSNATLGWVFFDLRPQFEADLKKFLNL